MSNNPYKDEYRRLVDSPPPAGAERELAYGYMMVDLYHALDEALGRIYELEQTLEGKAQQEEEVLNGEVSVSIGGVVHKAGQYAAIDDAAIAAAALRESLCRP